MNLVPKIQIAPEGPFLSKLVQGYWRLAEWNLSTQNCLSFIKDHVDLGITTVDHAHIYGDPSCESLFGRALKIDPAVRDQIEIVSKCGIEKVISGKVAHYNSSKLAIVESVELSLSRLGIECIDVLLIHRPDYLMNADEIAKAFLQLKADGKVKHLGVSNFNLAQFELLQSRIAMPLVTNQIEINPVNLDLLETGILERLQLLRVSPMAWSCLAGGQIFTGKSEKIIRLSRVLKEVSKEIGANSIDQVIYSWVMKMPSSPVPILGSGNKERIKAAVESLKLLMTHEQWYRILEASRGNRIA